MKVIKKGRRQSGWAKEFTCTGNGNRGGGCGAVLLVEQNDVYYTHKHLIDEHKRYQTFQCPECGVETDFKESLPFKPYEDHHEMLMDRDNPEQELNR